MIERQENEGALKEINKDKTTYSIICLIVFTQGVINLSDLAITYLLKDDMKLSPSQISIINGIIKIPWIIKPVWGYISDTAPIFGFRRKVYLIFLGILQFFFWIFLSFFGFNPIFAAFLLLIIQLCMAFCNVIGEAILVEISRDVKNNNMEYDKKQQTSASKNISLFTGVKYAGVLITSYLSGFLLDYLDKTDIFLITSVFPFMMGISGLFLHEKKHITATNGSHNILVEGITDDNYSNLWLLIVLSKLYILLIIPYALFIDFNKAQMLAEKDIGIEIEIEEFKMEERKNN